MYLKMTFWKKKKGMTFVIPVFKNVTISYQIREYLLKSKLKQAVYF